MPNDKNVIVNKDPEWLTAESRKVIVSQFFPPNVTNEEMIYCMSVAKEFNLNPILKQIYFVPRRSQIDGKWVDKVEPLAGRDSFLTLAHRTGKFAGIESEASIIKIPKNDNGKWIEIEDLVATAKVFRTDSEKPFVVSVSYNEYVQTKKDGTPTKFWADKPHTMLKKVAESQCLRKAFDITGLYDLNEMNTMTEKSSHTPAVESTDTLLGLNHAK